MKYCKQMKANKCGKNINLLFRFSKIQWNTGSDSTFNLRRFMGERTFLSFSTISSMLSSALCATLFSICVSHSHSSRFFSLKMIQAFSRSAISCLRSDTYRERDRETEHTLEIWQHECSSHRQGISLNLSKRPYFSLKSKYKYDTYVFRILTIKNTHNSKKYINK